MSTTTALNGAIAALQATGLNHETLDDYPLDLRAEAGRSVLQALADDGDHWAAANMLIKACTEVRKSDDADETIDRLLARDPAFMDELFIETAYVLNEQINDELYHRNQERQQDAALAHAQASDLLRQAVTLGHLNTMSRAKQGAL